MKLNIGQGWVVIASLWCANIFVVLTGFTLGILLPDIRAEFELSPVESGLLGSAFFLGFASFALPSSLWLSRYRPRLVNLVLTGASSLLLFLQGWAPLFWVLLVGRFLFVTLSVGRATPEVMLIYQWFEPHRVARVLSFNVSVLGIGQTISLAIGPTLLSVLGSWHNVYYLFGCGMLAATLVWYLFGKEHPDSFIESQGSSSLVAPLAVLREHRSIWLLALCQVGASITFASFMTFWPSFMIEIRDMPIGKSGPLFSLYPVGGFIGTSVAGLLSERIRKRKPIIWTSGLVLPFFYMVLVVTDNEVALAFALFFAGFFAFMVIPIVMVIPFDMGLKPRETAVALGLSRTFTPLAATLGPVLVGVIHQYSGSFLVALSVVVPMPFFMALIGILLPETSPDRSGISQE